jgi:hypothetical protein
MPYQYILNILKIIRDLTNNYIKYMFVVLALFMAVSCDDNSSNKEGLPKIKWTSKHFSFGVVPECHKVQTEYTFENTGKGVLTIGKIITGCGCTSSRVTKDKIQPGEKGIISIVFDTTGQIGEQNRNILVETNDPQNPKVKLTLAGKVKEQLVCHPRVLNFGPLSRGQKIEKEIEISILDDKRAIITDLISDNQDIILSLESYSEQYGENSFKKANNKKDYRKNQNRVRVTLQTENKPIGRFEHQITIQASSKLNKMQVKIPVYGDVVSSMIVKPSQLMFGVVRPGRKENQTVTIAQRYDTPFEIQRIEADINGLDIEFNKNVAIKSHILKIGYAIEPNIEYADQNIKGKLAVHTTNRDEPLVEIPVYIMLRK